MIGIWWIYVWFGVGIIYYFKGGGWFERGWGFVLF